MTAEIPAVGAESPEPRAERRVFAIVCAALLVLYLASLAPDVTLWDAGEFNAAIATLGIPHPPGTPLYILIARAWSQVLAPIPQAVAVNALSAVATACACAVLGQLLARWTRSATAGTAGGIAAGVMFSVWQNATETEVYAVSLLLAILILAGGELAGVLGSARHRALMVYLSALAVPVQISALVAAPAGILLAATSRDRELPSPVIVLALGAALLLVAGLGLASSSLLVSGLVALAAAAALGARSPSRAARYAPLLLVLLVFIGASATLYMLLRSAHDPGVNQGNPATWSRFVDVVARRQYDVPAPWPRRAPAWIQLGNLAQYADWQVAFGLDRRVEASWLRTPWSVAFGLLAVLGARWHWQRDRRSATGLAVLLACASLGVVTVLNLRAGPSIGVHVLPPDAAHEPRERDYFFALAFAVGGAWAGVGAASLAVRLRRPAWTAVAIAAVPILLNWRGANRRREPEASLAPQLGKALLESTPPRAVLLLAGDNDSYAVWYQQRVQRQRPDVTPVTLPLLGARWYRGELARRDSLLSSREVSTWSGAETTLRAIAAAAGRLGRPLAAAVSVPRAERVALRPRWTMMGLVFVVRDTGTDAASTPEAASDVVDAATTRLVATRIAQAVPALSASVWDPASEYVARILACPHRAVDVNRTMKVRPEALLDSRCNLK